MQLNWRSRFVYRHVLAPKNRIRRKTLGGNTFYGQAAQDLFVRTVLQELRDGTFLEFGSNDPISNNNTWFLEDRLGWSGIAVELEDEFVAATTSDGNLLVLNSMLRNFPWRPLFVHWALSSWITCRLIWIQRLYPYKY